MAQPTSELLLQRTLAYWAWSGVTIDAASEEQALAIVMRALHEPAEQRLSYCLQAMQAALPASTSPTDACPPLQRGSMHYGSY